jgi:uncharacterized protein YciI
MTFAIITRDKKDSSAIRENHQDEHRRYLARHKHMLLAAGAMLDDDETGAHGGVLLVEADSSEQVEEFVANDPFQREGLFGELLITRWRKAFFNFECLVPLD